MLGGMFLPYNGTVRHTTLEEVGRIVLDGGEGLDVGVIGHGLLEI